MKSAASKAAWMGRTACVVFVLAAVLAGCSGETAGSGDESAPAAAPEAKDDHATTVEGREVMIELFANDTGESLQIDGVEPGGANGDIICEAGIESGRIQSCAYTPIKGFTGTDEFEYTVKTRTARPTRLWRTLGSSPPASPGDVALLPRSPRDTERDLRRLSHDRHRVAAEVGVGPRRFEGVVGVGHQQGEAMVRDYQRDPGTL